MITTTVLRRTRAGWWHEFVCPTHDMELLPPEGDDDEFRCPYGCRCTGKDVTGAWTVLENQAAARRARLLARSAAADPGLRAGAVAILQDAAACYGEVAAGWSDVGEAWMLRGKLFAQALTEAIWAVQIADAVEVLAADGVELGDDVTQLLTSLLDTVVAARRTLVDERGDQRSNYTAWLDAAGSGLSRALLSVGAPGDPLSDGERDPATWAARVADHAGIAIADDGWEWEGSTYYHVFVLRAYLLALRGTRPRDLGEATAGRIAAMVRVLAELATPDGTLPLLHDGPYDRPGVHLEVLEICVLAGQLWDTTGLHRVERRARELLGDAHDGLEDLLAGWFEGPARPSLSSSRSSVLFPDVGYAVLRDASDTWQAVLDAGPHGGAHGHLDKLALYLHGAGAAWQPPPGVPPYGSALRRQYYARTIAHPTLRVDGADQLESTGQITAWEPTEDGGRVVARADDTIPGVRFMREVRMIGGHLLDIVRAETTDGSKRAFELALRPGVDLDVRVDGGRWTSRWGADSSEGPVLHGVHVASVPSQLVASPGRGPSHDPAKSITVADWKAEAEAIILVSVYSPQEPPSDVQLVLDADGIRTVRVSFADGSTHQHEVSR